MKQFGQVPVGKMMQKQIGNHGSIPIRCIGAQPVKHVRLHALQRFGKLRHDLQLPGILAEPGPVFVALKVLPEVENTPIGRRSRWQTRTRDKVVQDLRTELGVGGAS